MLSGSHQPLSSAGPVLNILFVCVGNACRSQMAEAFARHLGDGRFRVWSAGSRPLGRITEDTRAVLEEKHLSVTDQYSKGLKEVPLEQMDVVVTMGCEVECSVPPGFRGRVIEWNIADPFANDLDFSRNVRDLIEQRVTALIDQLRLSSKTSAASS
jgi:protein-tyrosine-phosphatase